MASESRPRPACRRFADVQARLGTNRSLLAERLRRLEAEGVVARRRYSQHPPRDEYEPTDKGRALWDVLARRRPTTAAVAPGPGEGAI